MNIHPVKLTLWSPVRVGSVSRPDGRVVSVIMGATIYPEEIQDAEVVRLDVGSLNFGIPREEFQGDGPFMPYMIIDEHGGLVLDVEGQEYERMKIDPAEAAALIRNYAER